MRFHLVLFYLFLAFALGCNRSNSKSGEAGLESGSAGIRIIATYDSRFDRIFERYKLLSVTFLNQSPNMIELESSKDAWTLTTRAGNQVRAINSLRMTDPKAWNSLPVRAQEVIEYPHVILRNTTVTFDLIFPKSVDLQGFKQIDFFSHTLNKEFRGGGVGGGEEDG